MLISMNNKIKNISLAAIASGMLFTSSKIDTAIQKENISSENKTQTADTIKSNTPEIIAPNLFTLLIDPGHDDKYTGFRVKKHKEENLTLILSKKIDSLLTKENYKVLLTRKNGERLNKENSDLNNDSFITVKDELLARANYIKNNNADCSIIIHYDAYPSSSKINGIRIYFYGISSKEQENDKKLNLNYPQYCTKYSSSSKTIAEKLGEHIALNGLSVKVYGSDMRILKENQDKTILYLELGYLTNPSDLKRATTEEGQNALAEIIAGFFIEQRDFVAITNDPLKYLRKKEELPLNSIIDSEYISRMLKQHPLFPETGSSK